VADEKALNWPFKSTQFTLTINRMIKQNCISHKILNQLLKGGNQYSNKIVRGTSASYTTVKKDIDKMIKIGLIKRLEVDKNNKRISPIKITPEGIEVALRLNKIQGLCK